MPSAVLPFGDLIGADQLAKFVDSSAGQRKRIYSPDVTLQAFLYQTVSRAGSCQEAVTEVYFASTTKSKQSPSLNTASYSRARGRLGFDAIRAMARDVHFDMNNLVNDRWRWQGRKVTIIDGSTVAMADTPDNVAVYPKRSSCQEYNGYPLARVMVASSLETGSIVDFSIAPWRGKSTGEIPLAAKLLENIERGSIVLAGAMFVSYSFIGLCQRYGLDFVGHKKTNRNFTIISEQKISGGDRLIRIQKPRIPHTGWIKEDLYAEIPDEITLSPPAMEISLKERIGPHPPSVAAFRFFQSV